MRPLSLSEQAKLRRLRQLIDEEADAVVTRRLPPMAGGKVTWLDKLKWWLKSIG